MLCDRATTNVAKAQSGFVSFGPLPLLKVIAKISPSKSCLVDRLLAAQAEFEAYAESESDEHKLVYLKK